VGFEITEEPMNDLLTPTTFWLTLGFLLMALELASGAAVLIFCGLGALAVGVLLAVGLDLSPVRIAHCALAVDNRDCRLCGGAVVDDPCAACSAAAGPSGADSAR
jgi:hypothetical protein